MTRPQPVSLEELDRAGALRRLDDDQAAALANTKLVDVLPEGSGTWWIVPAGRVGAVQIGDLEVKVQPKISIANLLFLLGYAADPGFRPEDVSGVPDVGLWPALGESLARQAERALGPGVLQGYVTIDESLALVRGRIRVSDQIAHRPGMLLPLDVRYDEYAADIPENQLLRTALRRMLLVPGLTSTVRARLAHLDGRLDGVRVLTPGAPLPKWRLTRLNARYAAALRLAEIVLRNQSAEAGPGGVTIAAFVVSMAKVFEDFVTTALREEFAAQPGRTIAQYPDHLDYGRTISIRPDVVHVVAGRPVAVLDAKYKLEDASSGYPNADVYQMLAYCTALSLSRGWLVYAHGDTWQDRLRVKNTSIDIVQYPLNLSAPPADLLGQVGMLARAALEATKVSAQARLGPTSLASVEV